MAPVLQLTSCEAKGCMFVINNNIAFSSHLIWIRREIWADQALFTNQESPEQFPNIRGFWSERTTGEGLFFHWRKHYYGVRAHFTSQDVN